MELIALRMHKRDFPLRKSLFSCAPPFMAVRQLSLYFHWKFFRPITYSAMTTSGTKYLKIGFIQS